MTSAERKELPMLLTENLAVRYREWRDRETEDPDLVPRLRRLWGRDRIEAAPRPRAHRRLLALRHRAALQLSRGA
jgi:hypothetical protein